MSPPFRIAINSLASRPKRTVLLVSTVMLSVALVVTVACGIASSHAAVQRMVDLTIGRSDVRLTHAFQGYIAPKVLDEVRTWSGPTRIVARELAPLPLLNPQNDLRSTPRGVGIELDAEYLIRPVTVESGRLPAAPGEILLDPMTAEELEADVGDLLRVERIGEPVELEVVGIRRRPKLSILQRKSVHIASETMREVVQRAPRYAAIDFVLPETIDPDQFVATHREELPQRMLLQTTERVTSNLRANIASSQVSFLLVGVLTFMAASFIILTGMLVAVAERTRELAVMRSVGAARRQLAGGQLIAGLMIGIGGAVTGVPLGLAMAWLLYVTFRDYLGAGFHIHPLGIVFGVVGSLGAGLIGAAYPAWQAASVSPLQGLTVRARELRPRGVIICTALGLLLIIQQPILLWGPDDLQQGFWTYVVAGLPLLYVGYFMICVPAAWVLAGIFDPVLHRLLRLPRGMIKQSVRAAPLRFAFTAGAQMVSLSIMISIWSSGVSLLRDWLDQVRFPDAFVHAWFGLEDHHYETLKSMPFVQNTCATTLFPVDVRNTDVFGVSGLQRFKINFVSFEPDEFFAMTGIRWIDGDEAYAKRRLNEGGAVIVAREFLVANKSLGIGDTIEVGYRNNFGEFEIVGVVASPGLDIATRIFGIGNAYLEQALSCVFGARSDSVELFANDDIHLIQVDLDESITDEEALAEISAALDVNGVTTGSGREIRAVIDGVALGMMSVGSVIAFASLVVACLGVGNVIMANLHARRFESGVLLAVGAPNGLLVRTIVAETLMIAAIACAMGIGLGLQIAASNNKLYELYGLELSLRIPILPITLGCALLVLLSIGFAYPAMRHIAGRQPRELLTGR
jgi:putative ABC transport system permease protein